MANNGPLGSDTNKPVIDQGTNIRYQSQPFDTLSGEVNAYSTKEGAARKLTLGEIAMSRSLFGNSINYQNVLVHKGGYFPFDLQDKSTAVTPNGEMYFDKSRFKEDFSMSSEREKHWFIHEMVHVWQYQLGYPVMFRGGIRVGLGYEYNLAKGIH